MAKEDGLANNADNQRFALMPTSTELLRDHGCYRTPQFRLQIFWPLLSIP